MSRRIGEHSSTALDSSLVANLQRGELDGISLTIPEIVSWERIAGFQYGVGTQARRFEELDLLDYFGERRPPDQISADVLRTDRVYLIDSVDESEAGRWPIYRCILAELSQDNDRYVLSDGKWYRVNRSFSDAVEQAVANLPSTRAPLPNALPQETEADYNQRVFDRGNGAFALFDRKLVAYPARGSVEICDLYWGERALLHVKRYAASSVLSHLFSQAVVSGQLLVQDGRFRTALRDGLPELLRNQVDVAGIRTQDFEIGFAVIGRRNHPNTLPFFSKVNLRNAANLLTLFGYRVTLSWIPVP